MAASSLPANLAHRLPPDIQSVPAHPRLPGPPEMASAFLLLLSDPISAPPLLTCRARLSYSKSLNVSLVTQFPLGDPTQAPSPSSTRISPPRTAPSGPDSRPLPLKALLGRSQQQPRVTSWNGAEVEAAANR